MFLDKINFILFKSNRKINPMDLTLKIKEALITKVEAPTFLDIYIYIYIDQHLTWKEDINYISLKLLKT